MTVSEMCGSTHSLIEKAEQGVLKCFGNVKRMNKERLTTRIYVSEVRRQGGREDRGDGKSEGSFGVLEPKHSGMQEAYCG